ncbi:hypothetical protein BU15DRAFT_84103 [Melanogaster broomeanus]|nr:hypothetical protein BU15DRAFT_84103 [Melanogaster broomeanus]
METTSKSAIAEAQARIDDEVALLKLPICALLTRRNALSPVSRLPHEILVTIFLYQAYSFYQDPRYSGTWGAPPWANVSYIAATGTVPLRIRVTHGYWAQEEMDFLEKVTRDVTRIQDLSLALPYTLAEGVFAKLSASVPLLHTLRLFVKHIGTDAILIPDTLFNRETPPLRTLELRRCRIPWPSPIFTGLTTLGLRDIASSSGPTITEFLAMLRHIPDLAHLYLENALSGAEGILASQDSLLSDCLELPHLSRLGLVALVAPFSALVVFLSNIIVPLKTELRLCCRGDIHDAESYTPLYPLLERRFSTISDVGPVIRTLNIKSTSHDSTIGVVSMKTGVAVFHSSSILSSNQWRWGIESD